MEWQRKASKRTTQWSDKDSTTTKSGNTCCTQGRIHIFQYPFLIFDLCIISKNFKIIRWKRIGPYPYKLKGKKVARSATVWLKKFTNAETYKLSYAHVHLLDLNMMCLHAIRHLQLISSCEQLITTWTSTRERKFKYLQFCFLYLCCLDSAVSRVPFLYIFWKIMVMVKVRWPFHIMVVNLQMHVCSLTISFSVLWCDFSLNNLMNLMQFLSVWCNFSFSNLNL